MKNAAALNSTAQKTTDLSASSPTVQFVVGGVQKAGTTALHDMLSQHPGIYMPQKKELHYFDNDVQFNNSDKNHDRYHEFFKTHKSGQICGEATPSYIYLAPTVERVKAYNPAMKWIVLLRHPVYRAYSHWNMQKGRGIETLNFEDALRAEPDRLKTLTGFNKHRYAYLARSRYAAQIENLLRYFDRHQCLFLTSDSVNTKFDDSLNTIIEFLELKQAKIEQKISHQGNYTSTISEETLAILCDQFAPDVAKTADLTGLDLQHWL